jgi:hypothetical protein
MMKCAQGSASARQGSRTVDWRIVDPELSPREIAAEAGISLRYLQNYLHNEALLAAAS